MLPCGRIVLDRFHWIVPQQLAGCSLPGRIAELPEDLAELREKGIGAVASLTEFPLEPRAIRSAGLEWRHFPIDDFSIPTIDQAREFCRWTDEQIAAKRAVAVHCFAGLGRTGTMIGCWLVREPGARTEQVLTRLRRIEPGFVQTAQQEAFIAVWESSLRR